jgi:hypothetical protein
MTRKIKATDCANCSCPVGDHIEEPPYPCIVHEFCEEYQSLAAKLGDKCAEFVKSLNEKESSR